MTMARLYCLVVLLFAVKLAGAQCKSGDCTTGKGVYDFGWCVYNGEFKNGKPDGHGTMKYDDYTYTGPFSNGVEDGQGAHLAAIAQRPVPEADEPGRQKSQNVEQQRMADLHR